MCSDTHDVVENTGELSKQNSDIFGSQRDINVEEFLHGQTKENLRYYSSQERFNALTCRLARYTSYSRSPDGQSKARPEGKKRNNTVVR